MDNIDDIKIQDCPICGGGALLEEEDNHEFYITCLDCGCHTVDITFYKPEDRYDAASRAAYLWNIGKVIKMEPGE